MSTCSLLGVLAFLQTCKERAAHWYTVVRTQYLVPLVHYGGRNMVLLRNGQWLDETQGLLSGEIVCQYDVVKHVIHFPGAERTKRWPWLSVCAGDRDISDFFEGLRISVGHELSNEQVVLLFAHQRGWLPTGDLHVITRSGEEVVIRPFTPTPISSSNMVESPSLQDVNYIR
jgi:hypothetical protein